jgi:hypothetical protein
MVRRLIMNVGLSVALACTASSTQDKTTAMARSGDSVILTGGQNYLMVHGDPVNTASAAGLRTSDSVIVVGGQGFKLPGPQPLSASTTSSTLSTVSGTTAIACKVEVHDGKPVSTPPTHVFVVTC